jgi:crotonobetainyl-CoA:carnitine CoA-transferase CaiB-like acyl-CoA transferase
MKRLPLEDSVVVDFSQGVAGPYCTRLLAMMGAEVIKVENPFEGDWARHKGPFARGCPGLENSLLFAYLNSNKRSLALDASSKFGRQTIRKLLDSAALVVMDGGSDDNPGSWITFEERQSQWARLVVTSISPFATDSAFAKYRATELNLYALGGLMSLVGGIGRPPLKAGGYQAQYMAGLQACAYALCGLWGVRATGEGCWIDVSIHEASAKIFQHTSEFTAGTTSSESPDEVREYSNFVHRCKDGHVTVTLYYFQIKALAELLGDSSLASDPRFSTEVAFSENQRALREKIDVWLRDKSSDEVQTEAQKRHLLFTTVNNVRDLIESPHLRERGFFSKVDHPTIGQAEYPGAPFRSNGPLVGPIKPAPLLGEANEAILCGQLGNQPEELPKLRADGLI